MCSVVGAAEGGALVQWYRKGQPLLGLSIFTRWQDGIFYTVRKPWVNRARISPHVHRYIFSQITVCYYDTFCFSPQNLFSNNYRFKAASKVQMTSLVSLLQTSIMREKLRVFTQPQHFNGLDYMILEVPSNSISLWFKLGFPEWSCSRCTWRYINIHKPQFWKLLCLLNH